MKAIDPEITPQRLTTFSIIPTFNPDGKYYTTAFLNPFDDEMEDDDKMITQHQSRVKEYSTEIAEDDIVIALLHSCCRNREMPTLTAAYASKPAMITLK